MLSGYEACRLVRTKADGIDPAPARAIEANRIGIALVALSLLSALALLYSAWFDWTPGPRTARAVPVSTSASPVIHPAAGGLPEAALFLRHPLRENADENVADIAVLRRGTSAR